MKIHSAAPSKPRFPWWPSEDQILQHENKLFLVLTLLIGAVVGLVIAAFIVLTEDLASRLYPPGGAAWRRLLLPVLGSLITGILLYRYFPRARGSGIPQTKTALFLQDGVILFRTVLGKFGLSSISLASGIALGREGPSVQVGAGIASTLGRWLGLGPTRIRALIPIGASAALAAAFNTPVAAVLFTLEEVMGDMHAPVLGSIVLSSATSWIVLHLVLGDEPLFHVPSYQLVHPAEFLAYAVLGALGGLVSVTFVKLLLGMRKWFLGFPKRTVWAQPVAGGLLVGVLGWFFPDVLGVGYAHVSQALNSQLTIAAMVLLVVLKIVATSTCYASGNAGGIFGPSLFIGAMMGGALGGGVHSLFPDYTGSAGAYALVGMGATFAGIIRTPLTSVIMIFEITRDYSIIVPLMIANVISYFISHRMQPESIYEALQHQEGFHLPPSASARESVLLVREVERLSPEALAPSTSVADALARMDVAADALPVLEADALLSVVTRAQLERAVEQGRGEEPVSALAPMTEIHAELGVGFPHVYPDDSLDTALRRMADAEINVLPVVGRSDIHRLEGFVSVRGILDAYGVGDTSAGGKRLGGKRPSSVTNERIPGGSYGLLIGMASMAVALMIVIGLLNFHYRTGRQDKARIDYETGNQLLQQGRAADAVERYRNALSVFPGNNDYRLALGIALLGTGNPGESEVYLLPVLKNESSNGRANLALARSRASQGKQKEAEDYYHRAIYGNWPVNAPEERLRARFELVDYLAPVGATTQVTSELLAVAGQAPDNLEAIQRAGDLLLKFGSAKQAIQMFQTILSQDDHNSKAHEGLGRAQLFLGDYQAALEPLRESVQSDPRNSEAKNLLGIAEKVRALDPLEKGVNRAERARRSAEVLSRSVGDLKACVSVDRDLPELQQVHKLLNSAGQILARRAPQVLADDAMERNISLAEQIRKSRKTLCSLGGAEDEVLDRVLMMIAKQ